MLEEMHNNRLCMDVFCLYIDVLVFSYLFTFVVQFFFSVSMRNYGALYLLLKASFLVVSVGIKQAIKK